MKKISAISLVLLITVLFSCKKDTVTNTVYYTVPASYIFTNVNDSNQVILLLMADQIGAKVNTANTVGGYAVAAQTLKDMFNNVNGYFTDTAHQLNGSGLRLSDHCPASVQTDLFNYFDSVGVYSASTVVASAGIAGVGVSLANKKLLLSPTGIFYSQLIKKTIQDGICATQIADVYLADSVSNSIDNTTVIAGSGTAMEHHWDEAFGYFGVPVNFPAVTTGAKYLASYSNQVDAGLHSNSILMNAFLEGRAAISNKDLAGKQAQANIIIHTIDQLEAAQIVQEMKETDANIDAGDSVAAYGTLSEATGFVRGMKYNTSSSRIITNAQIAQLEALFDAANPSNPNLYLFINASVNSAATIKAKTDAIRQLIGTIYGFNSTELANL